MLNYKPAALHKAKSRWYIDYSLQHPITGQWHRIPYTKGLNVKKSTPEQRRKTAANALQAINEMLKNGELNPWEEPAESETLTVEAAMAKAYDLKIADLKGRSQMDYKSSYKHFMEGAKQLGYDSHPITKFNKGKIIEVLNHVKNTRKLSNNRWNFHKHTISSLLSVLVDREIIENNPVFRVAQKKVSEGTVLQPPTDKEQAIIDNHLFANNKPLFIFKSLVYTTGVRPDEALKIKVSDIDFESYTIKIEAVNTKVGLTSKTLPIIDDMLLLLTEHLKGAVNSDYVFSLNLLPGKTKIHRNTVTNYWRKSVIKKTGINKKLYAQKHRGTDDKILAGIDLDYLRQVYGHSSKRMTERYASQLKNKAHDEIRKKSPGILKGLHKSD